MPNINWLPSPWTVALRGARHKKRSKNNEYEHIKVMDFVDHHKQVRRVVVEVPLSYPGLNERERRKMTEGLSMIGDAFRQAEDRLEAAYYRKKIRSKK